MAAMIDAYILRCDYDGPYRGYVWRIENTLKAFQSYVDGPIQALTLTPEIAIVCNDEGKLHQFPLNRAYMEGSKVLDYFVGNILCVRHSGDEFASIAPEDVAVIERLLIPLKSVSKEGGHAFVTIPADHCPEWRPFYAIDFSSMSPEERYELMTRPQDDMESCFENEPLELQRLAMALIFTRWWNSYKHMVPEEPTPEIIGTAIELLWDFLEGKCGDREFDRFQKSFYEAARMTVFSFVGEDSLKKDTESETFYQAHCSHWEGKSYNNFFIWLATLLEDIAGKDGYNLYWLPVEYILFNDIETMIDFFEEVYQGGRVNPDDPLSGLKRREREIYNTPTFARVIALLQQDMRAALSDTPLAELRAKYRDEYLFSPEESAKISHFGRG